MSGPPMRKDEISALESLVRGKARRDSVEDNVFSSLSSRGMIEERRSGVQITARGRMNVQRRNSVRPIGKR